MAIANKYQVRVKPVKTGVFSICNAKKLGSTENMILHGMLQALKEIIDEEKIGIPILLGDKETIENLMESIDFEGEVNIIDPKSEEHTASRKRYAKAFWETQKRRGKTLYECDSLLKERNYYAAMMVREGDADSMLSGFSRKYPAVVKPILEVMGKAKGVDRVAATNLMLTKRGMLFLSDTSINIDPSPKELAKIAQMTAQTVGCAHGQLQIYALAGLELAERGFIQSGVDGMCSESLGIAGGCRQAHAIDGDRVIHVDILNQCWAMNGQLLTFSTIFRKTQRCPWQCLHRR